MVTNTHTHACIHTSPEGEREGEGSPCENLRVDTECPDLTGRATTSTTASTLADMTRCAVQQSISNINLSKQQSGAGETPNRES